MARIRISQLILSLVVSILISSLPVNAQEETGSVKLLLLDFVQDTNESLSQKTIDIKPLLKEAFNSYDEISIADESGYAGISSDRLQAEMDSAQLSTLDAVVYGSYVVINEYVKIQSVVYTTSDGMFHRVNYSRGTFEGLNTLVNEVRDNIFETLVQSMPALQQSVKKIAFVNDYETVSGKYENMGMMKNKSRQLTREIMQNVEYAGPANTEVMPWSAVIEYLDNPSGASLIELDPDMFIKLTYVFSGNEVVAFRAEFDILEMKQGQMVKREFTLPTLKWDYYKEIDFQHYITMEMLAFLDRIVDQAGQWDYRDFPNKSAIKTSNMSVLTYRARNFAEMSDFYLSSYYYAEAMDKFPEEVKAEELRLQIGFNKVYTDRFDEANEEFDFVLASDPDNSYAYLGKSLISYYEGDAETALTYLETAREKGVENTFLVEVLKGYYFYEQGRYQDALDAFNKSLSVDQGIIGIRIINNLSIDYIKIHIGLCHVGLGEYEEAIAYYKQIKKDYAYNKETDYYLGNAYSKKAIDEYFAGNYGQAISDFINSRKYFANPNVNDYIRTAYVFEQRFDEARQFIAQELEAGNYDPMFVWFEHAMDVRTLLVDKSNRKDGTYDESIGNEVIGVLNKNAEVNPNDPLTYYYIGEIYTLMGDFAQGLNYMEKAYELENISFDIQLGLMQSYLLTGRYGDCEKLKKSLTRLYRKLNVPDRFTALMEYLDISASMAQEKKAKKSIKELDDLLENKIVIDGWFYEPYLSWLENCNCTDETKSYLAELTARMKERDLE